MSVLKNMSADELHDYMAYLSFEPVGSVADDVRTAIVAHTTACCLSTKPPEFSEFIPKWEPPRTATYREGAKAFEAFLKA